MIFNKLVAAQLATLAAKAGEKVAKLEAQQREQFNTGSKWTGAALAKRITEAKSQRNSWNEVLAHAIQERGSVVSGRPGSKISAIRKKDAVGRLRYAVDVGHGAVCSGRECDCQAVVTRLVDKMLQDLGVSDE